MEIKEIEEKINKLLDKRDKLVSELNTLNDKIFNLIDKRLELNEDMIRIVCPECGGTGYIKTDDERKKVCHVCKGKEFVWAEKYEGR